MLTSKDGPAILEKSINGKNYEIITLILPITPQKTRLQISILPA